MKGGAAVEGSEPRKRNDKALDEDVPMPRQEPEDRVKNFTEVALGYTEEMALAEAARCLKCKNPPCRKGCPVDVPIPQFIEKIIEGKYDEGITIIKSKNALPAVCGRGCPQELVDLADTVSEIADRKHAFKAGVKAQAGIDF